MTKRVAFLMLLPMLFLPLRPVAATSTATDCVEKFEGDVVRLVNAERAARGLAKLTISDTLSAADEHFVQDASHYGWFGHYLHDGTSAEINRDRHGYDFNVYQGQIIAMGQQSPSVVVAAWMASGPHRDVILNPRYRTMGSGYTKRSDGTRFWAADFGAYRDSKADYCL